jgi:hypothetical protein
VARRELGQVIERAERRAGDPCHVSRIAVVGVYRLELSDQRFVAVHYGAVKMCDPPERGAIKAVGELEICQRKVAGPRNAGFSRGVVIVISGARQLEQIRRYRQDRAQQRGVVKLDQLADGRGRWRDRETDPHGQAARVVAVGADELNQLASTDDRARRCSCHRSAETHRSSPSGKRSMIRAS